MALTTFAYLYLAYGVTMMKFPVNSRSVTINQLRQQRIKADLDMSLLIAALAAVRLLS